MSNTYAENTLAESMAASTVYLTIHDALEGLSWVEKEKRLEAIKTSWAQSISEAEEDQENSDMSTLIAAAFEEHAKEIAMNIEEGTKEVNPFKGY